jgi:DNA-binding NtrC family response regulator
VETSIATTLSDLIIADDLKPLLENHVIQTMDYRLSSSLKKHERILILKALEKCGYVVKSAAVLLAIDESNLRKKIKEHNIDLESLRGE